LRGLHEGRIEASTAAIATTATAQTGNLGLAQAQTTNANRHAGNSSFSPLKQIDAGSLNVGYAEAGPADGPGPAILLLHDTNKDVDVG